MVSDTKSIIPPSFAHIFLGKGIVNTAYGWIRQLRSNETRRQQWNNTSSTELQRLASPPHKPDLDNQTTTNEPRTLDFGKNIFSTAEISRHSNRYTQGWRFGAIICAVSACVVCVVNCTVTVWASVNNRANKGVLFEGDCEKVRQMNTGLHLLINLLSTVLLSSSNYCMQCLSAPTRNEIDKAHAQGNWLDVGIPSVRNLRRINKRRVGLWALLGLSSLPLHLFYNSVVFSSISANNYWAFSVSQSFIDDPECTNCNNSIKRLHTTWGESDKFQEMVVSMHTKARNGTLDRLENRDCINQYAQMIQSSRRNVLLVASDDNFPPLSNNTYKTIVGSHIYWLGNYEAAVIAGGGNNMAYDWICSASDLAGANDVRVGGECIKKIAEIKSAPEGWRIGGDYTGDQPGFPVQHCLSERAEPHCKLQFILPIAVLVTILNFFKVCIILYTAFGVKEDPLMTMGDAVASFLEKKDHTTKNMCLLSIRDVKKHKGYFPVGPKSWTDKKNRWKDVTSPLRRFVTVSMFSIALIIIGHFFYLGMRMIPQGQSRKLAALASIGFGAVDPRLIVSLSENWNTIQYILIVNLPQAVLSFIYFSYNGLFTAMLMGHEWNSYAHRRKGLRLSRAPTGDQRSTYFLQLPYRFAIPLMALSGVLHWLVSQSIFLVAIDVYDIDGSRPPNDGWSSGSTSCGFSPIAIVIVIAVGGLMPIAALAFGFIPYKEGMNLAGSCSAATSAACHNEEVDGVNGHMVARGKLQWGVLVAEHEGVGHCAFSTQPVQLPKKGEMYAGAKGT